METTITNDKLDGKNIDSAITKIGDIGRNFQKKVVPLCLCVDRLSQMPLSYGIAVTQCNRKKHTSVWWQRDYFHIRGRNDVDWPVGMDKVPEEKTAPVTDHVLARYKRTSHDLKKIHASFSVRIWHHKCTSAMAVWNNLSWRSRFMCTNALSKYWAHRVLKFM